MEYLFKENEVIKLATKAENSQPHPAKYNDNLLKSFAELVNELGCQKESIILDVFGGVGKIGRLKEMLDFKITVITSELEEEWAKQGYEHGVDFPLVSDSTCLPIKDKVIDFVITSPTYGNRMADSHIARDNSVRNTYTHKLGRKLSDNNTGKMQWGENYRKIHGLVYSEVFRTLKQNGYLILNMKDHIRSGKRVYVTDWHIQELENKGFKLLRHIKVQLKGNGFGANAHLRVPYESILLFKKKN